MDSITVDGVPLKEYVEKQEGVEIRRLWGDSMKEMQSCRSLRFFKLKASAEIPKPSPVYSYTEKEKRRYVIMNTQIEAQNQRKTKTSKTLLLVHVLRNWKEIRDDLINVNYLTESDISKDVTCEYATHYLNERYSENPSPYVCKDISGTITNLMKKLVPLKLARSYSIGRGNKKAYQISEDFLNMPMRQLLYVLNVKQKEGDPNILNLSMPDLSKKIQEDEEKEELDSYLKTGMKITNSQKKDKQNKLNQGQDLQLPSTAPTSSKELFLNILDKYDALYRVREIILDKEGTLRVIF